MKSNIFIVHTEYHLMLSINIIVNSSRNFDNYIFIADKNRIRKDLQQVNLNIKISRINDKDYGTNDFFKYILDKEPENFFFFQQISSDNMYLAYKMHHNGINVILLQDGLKAYQLWNRKKLWAHIILDTFTFHYKMIKRKTFIPYFKLNNLSNYGGWSFIDELWLSFPEKFINRNNKKIKQIPDFSSESIAILNKIFSVNQYTINPDAIMIIGQPRLQEYWEKERLIIKEIVDRFENKEIYFKPHPNTKKGQLDLIKNIERLKIINYPIPAELLILQMKNTCIISSHSTALLTNNPTCRFYWVYKIFGNSGRLFSQVKIVNPTSHIREVLKLDEII